MSALALLSHLLWHTFAFINLFPAAALGSKFHLTHKTFPLTVPSKSLSLPTKSESSGCLCAVPFLLPVLVLLSSQPQCPFYIVAPHLLILAALWQFLLTIYPSLLPYLPFPCSNTQDIYSLCTLPSHQLFALKSLLCQLVPVFSCFMILSPL